ncbi:MAG: tetratricopeptide repeat protein [Bacteroidota bacterium]
MKRTIIIIAFVAAASCLHAQKLNVQSAYSSYMKGFLDKAKNYIDPAILDPTTKEWAKTWMYRGNIYYSIVISTEDKYKFLDADALTKAYESYQKAIELDTKKEYWENLEMDLNVQFKLYLIGEQYYNKGVENYIAAKYVDAMNYFDKTASINATFSIPDSVATFNAAICADNAGLPDKAIEYYKKLIKINYLKPEIYSNLINIYREQFITDNPYKKISLGTDTNTIVTLLGRPAKVSKENINKTNYDKWEYSNKFYMLMEFGKVSYYNTDSVITELKSYNDGLKIIEKGVKLFPDSNVIIKAEANLYLAANKFDEAKTVLDKLLAKDPTNPLVYYAIGNVYFDQYNNESNPMTTRENAYIEAEKACKKAVELKSDFFDAIYMLGALYFNEGFRLESESENYISDPTKYNQYKEKFDVMYKQATESLEKAAELKPDNYDTLISLKKLYARLNMTDKYNAVNEKLKLLK